MKELVQTDTDIEKYERRYMYTIILVGCISFPLWITYGITGLSLALGNETIYSRIILLAATAVFLVLSLFRKFEIEFLRTVFHLTTFSIVTYYSTIVYLNGYVPENVALFFLLVFLSYAVILSKTIKKNFILFTFTYNLIFVSLFKIDNNSYLTLEDWSGLHLLGLFNFIAFLFISDPNYRKHKNEMANANEKIDLMKKWVALGQITGGIAHEINSPLNAAFLKVDLLKKQIGDSPAVLKKVDDLKSVLDRISKIIQSLKFLAMNEAIDELEVVNVKSVLTEVLSLSEYKFTKNKVELRIFNNLSEDFVYELNQTTIIQVLMNLINNAIDAIKERDERWLHIILRKDETCDFMIEVMDSGEGIDESVKQKMFNMLKPPSSDLKKEGMGLGLGLGLCKKIMEYHGGDIYVDAQSKNTKFVVKFVKKSLRNESKKNAA